MGAYYPGTLIEGREVTAGGMAASFLGGALGPLGGGAVALTAKSAGALVTAGQMAAFEVAWGAEVSLASAAAGTAF